jgi:hypothetical protein
MTMSPTWQGTAQEGQELNEACRNNCTCKFNQQGVRTSTCPVHEMILDQSLLNDLLFARRIRDRFRHEEGCS